ITNRKVTKIDLNKTLKTCFIALSILIKNKTKWYFSFCLVVWLFGWFEWCVYKVKIKICFISCFLPIGKLFR
ncbi:MAG: hypothetical protein DRI95_10670, partial [Bacteroidetes bacterium]